MDVLRTILHGTVTFTGQSASYTCNDGYMFSDNTTSYVINGTCDDVPEDQLQVCMGEFAAKKQDCMFFLTCCCQ